MSSRVWATLCLAGGSLLAVHLGRAPAAKAVGGPAVLAATRSCPLEMADMGSYCIDRFEVHTVDDASGRPLSPYYPPEPRLLRFVHDYWSLEASRVGTERARALPIPTLPDHQRGHFSPRAASGAGVLPQGYMTYYSAKKSCEAAGKRLCTEREWTKACRGAQGTKHPYGDDYVAGRCNVFRPMHPAYELHGNSSLGHLDPRLHLVFEEGTDPLLERTGTRSDCASQVKDGEIYDMVGNLDEWIADEKGVFVGGFYSRSTKEGCEARIAGHSPRYTDYSLGTRCCK